MSDLHRDDYLVLLKEDNSYIHINLLNKYCSPKILIGVLFK